MKNTFTEIEIISNVDEPCEKNLLFFPDIDRGQNIPLVVSLHVWDVDRFNQMKIIEYCRIRNWALLIPEFCISNLPGDSIVKEVCGSQLACQDIIYATKFVQTYYSIDKNATFLIGSSGGGYMSLMTSAYEPKMWRGVSAWNPVTDVALWHEHCEKGKTHTFNMKTCCCGIPGDSPEVDYEYSKRSPMTYLTSLAKVNLSVHHGRFDQLVPYIHTINLAESLNALHPEKFFFEILNEEYDFVPKNAFIWFDKILNNEKFATKN